MVNYDALIKNTEPQIINVAGCDVPIHFKRGSIDSLIVLFHGGMDRSKRDFPFFQPFLPFRAHQLSVSDPTLFEDTSLPSGWYLGAEGKNLPEALAELFRQLAEKLGAKRRIYVGGSAGGFAALLYSHYDSGSLAIPSNPQTNLETYSNSTVARLQKICWPSTKSFSEWGEVAPISLPNLYKSGFKNNVIYIQSAGDFDHVQSQLTPFMGSVDILHRKRLICYSGFWGISGHSGSVPPRAWVPWVRTALLAPNFTTDRLLETHYALTNQSASVQASSAKNNVPFSAADIAKVRLLNDQLLKG